jgi:hypothetical protein
VNLNLIVVDKPLKARTGRTAEVPSIIIHRHAPPITVASLQAEYLSWVVRYSGNRFPLNPTCLVNHNIDIVSMVGASQRLPLKTGPDLPHTRFADLPLTMALSVDGTLKDFQLCFTC